ncbi:MAG: flavin monoamine oxidase family protein [Betaproteobacteria bacterium]
MKRRLFLELVGRAGGAAAVHSAMRALDLQAPADAPPFAPAGRAPAGARVLVLGAGLAGLTAAYELQKLGYTCEVLEARGRPGGRACTIRRGVVSEEVPPTGGQVCAFDEGLYLNPGPMRIPNSHSVTLHYCRELDVPLEMFTTLNEAAYVHSGRAAGGATAKLRLRELRTDWRGATAELLAKAVSQDALDADLTGDDKARLLDWLRVDGDLDGALRYRGSARRGYRQLPDAGDAPGLVDDPLTLAELLRTTYSGAITTTELWYQTPMFQPVGGMDRLPRALAARVRNVKLGAEILAIEQPAGRVRVRYRNGDGVRETEAPYAICTLPLPILCGLPVDMAPETRAAIADVRYASVGKMGLQFKRRFWEEDEGIYSGVTSTDLEITQIVYPSCGYHSRKGVLVGYYQNSKTQPQFAIAMGRRSPADRLAVALEQGARIHPQYPHEFETAFSVAWENVKYSRGGWAIWTDETRKGAAYRALCRPDRRLHFAGDHVSYTTSWMQGAFQSGRAAAAAVHARASRDALVAG